MSLQYRATYCYTVHNPRTVGQFFQPIYFSRPYDLQEVEAIRGLSSCRRTSPHFEKKHIGVGHLPCSRRSRNKSNTRLAQKPRLLQRAGGLVSSTNDVDIHDSPPSRTLFQVKSPSKNITGDQYRPELAEAPAYGITFPSA